MMNPTHLYLLFHYNYIIAVKDMATQAKCSIYILQGQGCIDQMLIGILISANTMAPVVNSHQYAPKIESTFYSQTKQFDN